MQLAEALASARYWQRAEGSGAALGRAGEGAAAAAPAGAGAERPPPRREAPDTHQLLPGFREHASGGPFFAPAPASAALGIMR